MTESLETAVPAVIGHRGAAGHAPENTIASISRAADLGVRWVEFDIKLSADGEVVVFHDDKLNRTTNGRGAVAKHALIDLRQLDAGSWFKPRFAGERVPTLSEMLEVLAARGLGANIEIKPSPGRYAETGAAIGRLLKAEWPAALTPPVISSFMPTSLAAVRDHAPEYERALLVFALPGDWQARAHRLGCAALHCSQEYLTERQAKAITAAGFVLRCYTVNHRLTARKLYRWGASSLISDYPARLLSKELATA